MNCTKGAEPRATRVSNILRRTSFAHALLLASAISLAACQTTTTGAEVSAPTGGCFDETPLPSSLNISSPGDDVPADVAAFSGVWGDAKWDGNLCHTLVVTSIDADGDVRAIYSTGTYEGWGIDEGSYFKPRGTIENGTLTLRRFGNGANVAYELVDGKLEGSYERNGNVSRVTLSKMP